VKLAGVGSVSTPDATDAVKGIVELATPTEATAGSDTTRAVTPAGLKSALAAQVGSASAPAAPTAGQVWVDSSTSPSTIKVWNGTAWVPQAGSTITSSTAPTTPATGQIWIDTSASPSVTKIWDGTAWVVATPDGSAATAIANDAKYATKAELQAEDLWDRAGTEITPKTAGDSVFTTGAVKVGGTTAAPNLQIKSDGGIVANTDGLVYDAAQKRLAIGTTSPAEKLEIQNGSISIGSSSNTSTTNTLVAGYGYIMSGTKYGNVSIRSTYDNVNNSGQLEFYTSNGPTTSTERACIDSSGRLLVGTSSSSSALTRTIELHGAGSDVGQPAFQVYAFPGTGASDCSYLQLFRSRGSSVGTNTIVASGDRLGMVRFSGANGSGYDSAAEIYAEVDGTPGAAGDMPGRLVFSTTSDGASSPTERMRITNEGVQAYNQAAPAAVDTTATLTVANLKTGIITSSTAAAVTMTLPTGTDTEAGFSGVYTNMTFEWTVINTGATNAVTIAAGTGHTIVGSATVAASNSGRFATRRTAANTFVTYRLSS
jgi:CheY-specific phosphatase CheX